VYCYWRFAYINVLTIAAMFFFAANTDVFIVGGYYYYNAKIIVTYIVVIKLPQFLLSRSARFLQEKGTRSIGPRKTPRFSLELLPCEVSTFG
jgi:hypothetical protein